MNRWIAFVVTITIIVSHSAVIAQTKEARLKINLDDDWKFHFGHAADASKDFNYTIANIYSKSSKAEKTAINPKFNDSAWRTLDLPHDWAVELPFEYSGNFDVMAHGYKPVGGLYPQNSIGWYRKHFKVNKADSGKRFCLQFDGIFRDSRIWINGFYMGANMSGYTGAIFDVTDYMNYNNDNVIVVRVDASQYEGWFYEGAGIYRHVWLVETNQLHLDNEDGIFVKSAIHDDVADITVDAHILNEGFTNQAALLQSRLLDRNGVMVAETRPLDFIVAASNDGLFIQSLSVSKPVKWSLNEPYLYRLITRLVTADGKLLDEQITKIGLRSIEMSVEKGVLLNGEPIKLQGTNNHQDHAGVGAALPDFLQFYRIKKLKELGCNAYRASHNPPTPELLDACDSLGMLVLDETRLLNSSNEYKEQLRKLIVRDRNRPSVFLWSIGNEEGYIQTNSYGYRIARTMIELQRQLDPTRTCTYAADVANVYKGINEVIPVRGFNYRQFAVADYHKDHPNQPIVGTEMGSTVTTRGIYKKDTINAYVPDQDITAPWWASRAEEWWPLAANNNYWLGGFVWTGFDYRGEPTPYEWPNISSHFGIMDVCGFPKNIYYYYQSWWTNKDVLHISAPWNEPHQKGDSVDVWINSNADEVELFIGKKSMGRKPMPRNGHVQYAVTYQPASLKAIAYKQGRKFERVIPVTTAAYQLQLLPDVTTVKADGKNGTVINVIVKDKAGNEVSNANNKLNFSIEGDAKIIGVGNGDPSSHEADKCKEAEWQRSLFNGKCQLILQTGTRPGNIIIRATAGGLQPAQVVLVAVE